MRVTFLIGTICIILPYFVSIYFLCKVSFLSYRAESYKDFGEPLQGYPPIKSIQILLFIVSMTQLEPINIIRSGGTDREMPLIIYRRLYFTAVRLSPRRHFSPVVVSECYIDIAVT